MEQTANALPPVTLGQYKGLPVTRRVRPVTEAAVASELKSLARRHAPFCATSAPAARGMRVTLDFEGRDTGHRPAHACRRAGRVRPLRRRDLPL